MAIPEPLLPWRLIRAGRSPQPFATCEEAKAAAGVPAVFADNEVGEALKGMAQTLGHWDAMVVGPGVRIKRIAGEWVTEAPAEADAGEPA